MQYAQEIFYMHDQVTEDTASIGVGEVWLYFFKESLIGVRNVRPEPSESFFMTLESKTETNAPMAPTIEKLTEEHIQEAISEHDATKEVCTRVHMTELFGIATRLVMTELNIIVNERMLGND